jgi:hypothetical protein
MLDVLSHLPLSVVVVIVILVVVWRLPAFGHRILRFLRDLRDYRAGR